MGRMISPAPMFGAHLPIEMLECTDDGRFVTAVEFTDQHLNAAGAVHGGCIAAVLDVALAGGGAASGGPAAYGITLSITVNFVSPLSPGRAVIDAVSVGGGRQTRFVEAKLRDAVGAVCATASGTVRVVPHPDGGTLTDR